MKSESKSVEQSNSDNRLRSANKVTITGSIANLILSFTKLAAGILGQSHAMVADAIHSFSDLGTDLAVLIGLYLSSHPQDKKHNYGHGKFETFATLIIAITLLTVGIGIGWSGFQNILSVAQGEALETPRTIALIAAIVSVVIKEWLFRYTKRKGTELNSSSLVANAHHHRSDAYSSFGTGLGILGAIVLGNKWVILDPIAAVVVSVLILKEAISIGIVSINELLETSISEEEQEKIILIASRTMGVVNPHNLKTRRIGNTIALDLHIRVSDSISVREGHDISHDVEARLLKEFGHDLLCSIHVEPVSLKQY